MKNENASHLFENETQSYVHLALQNFSALCRSKLEELKTKLIGRLSAEFPEVLPQFVRQAVAEADALASLTTFPHLLLPALAEEKVLGLRNWTNHQRAISRYSGLAFAA